MFTAAQGGNPAPPAPGFIRSSDEMSLSWFSRYGLSRQAQPLTRKERHLMMHSKASQQRKLSRH